MNCGDWTNQLNYQTRQGYIHSLHIKSSALDPKSSSASSYTVVSSLQKRDIDQHQTHPSHIQKTSYLFPTLLAPRTGFAADFGFFFPVVFSRCFSFASVVSPLAALRTSTSRRGRARARAWCSTNVEYSGLSWCRLTICAMMASESATKSSLDEGDDFRILSRSASAEEPVHRHK